MSIIVTYKEELIQITAAVFDSILAIPVAVAEVPDNFSFPYDLEAEVRIQGAWNGRLILRCTEARAREWAERLICPDPALEDLSDAAGELANMIGGNLKAVLPPSNRLSVPTVRCHDALTVGPLSPGTNTFAVFDGPEDFLQLILEEKVSRAAEKYTSGAE